MSSRLDKLRGAGVQGGVRLIFRKLVYRNVLMRRYDVPATEAAPPTKSSPYRFEFLEKPEYEAVLASNPHLSEADMTHLRKQRSSSVAVYDGERIIASCWHTSGHVYVGELHRYIEVPEGEHYSCRAFVDPDYRGQDLLHQMYYAYARRVPAGDLLWGLVYPHNTPAIRSAEKLGRTYVADYWTRFVFGRKYPGQRSLDPRRSEEAA